MQHDLQVIQLLKQHMLGQRALVAPIARSGAQRKVLIACSWMFGAVHTWLCCGFPETWSLEALFICEGGKLKVICKPMVRLVR